jgi:[protein-PII] uridylyltransferase
LDKIEASAKARLTLDAAVSPSQELARYKRFLKVETHRLKILHRAGGSGRQICQARAAILDVLIRSIFDAVQASSPELARHPIPSIVLVAIGGYGRAELNPHSDIDLMFLFDGELVVRGKVHPGLTAITDGVLYTLWDIGLKLGYSVRTIQDCVRVANSDMQSKTSLIEARLITGDEALFQRMQSTVLAKCVRGFEEGYIASRLADQAARRAKFGNSACMQEPNIKNGSGGLRDYQNLIWMTFFQYQTRSLAELEEKEMISPGERKQLESAYDYLLGVRNELHYLLNRAVDVVGRAIQPAVAQNLGFTDRSPSRRVQQFMRELYTHLRNIDLITRTVEQRLALIPQTRRLPSLRRFIQTQRERARQQLIDGFKFLDGQIYPGSSRVFRDQPRRLMRVFLHAQQRRFSLHPDTTQLIRNNLSLVNREFLRDLHVRDTFLEILDHRGSVAPILRTMHDVGLLGKFIPEFGRLTCLVQHEFYHQYAADEHTLVCIEKLDHVWKATEPPFSNYAQIFQYVERPFILYLALLLHDAGKALHIGKHADVGGQLAFRVARRLELDGATTHKLRLVIEHHLAMIQISQRRDIDDPKVIKSFARQVQTLDNLTMLTLHTFADSMGTSDHLWNSFKDTLLWTLFHKTRRELEGGAEAVRAEATQRELLLAEVLRLRPHTISDEEIEAHFSSLPPRYFQINSTEDIVRDLALTHKFMQRQIAEEDQALSPVIAWLNQPDRGYAAVHICTWDRAGLFSKITGSLTAAGLNILGAEILTRDDGIILDRFLVTDARTGFLPKREEREKFETILEKVLTGGKIDLAALIAPAKLPPSPYQSLEGEQIPTVIHFDNETSETRTVLDVETEDCVGLLYSISQALSELDLDISLAKISTEKGAAIDSFYIAERNGRKVFDSARQKEIEEHLRAAIARVKPSSSPPSGGVVTRNV